MEEILSTFKYVPRRPALGDALPIDQPDWLNSSFSSVHFSLDLVDPRIIGARTYCRGIFVFGSCTKYCYITLVGYPRHRPTCTAQSPPLAPQKPGTELAQEVWSTECSKIPALGVEGLLPNDTSKCAF
ncbi:uncharacterized protein P884DRAFT_313011 [Thermothelomyces heterothallicus CBS 202.75]|uniref:uncharacterized protein n=1 Tax=Thermothelomyces heterothallicus CBS 202.75 TaxID=1149848 RepID=UPI003742C251